MRVLLLTGKLARPILEEAIKGYEDQITIISLDYPVASLMSMRYILEKLKARKDEISSYDYLILPGLVYGDAKILEKELGVRTYKGTENAWDVGKAIEALRKGIELSTIYPADVILKSNFKEEIEATLRKAEEKALYSFDIGLKVPLRPPPFRIFLELNPSSPLDKWIEEVERTRNFVDAYVVGFPVGFNDIDEVRRRVKAIKDIAPVIGIDSDSPYLLKEGIKGGASIVFNLNETNVYDLEDFRKDAAFVVAPFTTENRAQETLEIVKKAKVRGYEKLIADPVLGPPLMGFTDSIMEYSKLSRTLRDVPMLMGSLNVTELLDADSHGINSLLSVIGMELGISIFLTMEKGKTKWSSWELRRATKMMTVAHEQGKVPKGLGIDLLIVKEKKRVEVPPISGQRIKAEKIEPKMDSGYFRIFLENRKIVASFSGRTNVLVEGEDGLSVGRTILREIGQISPDHALYLGYELAKAEIASSLDKSYIQDEPLVRRIGCEDSSSKDYDS